jgi:hypothetical protein
MHDCGIIADFRHQAGSRRFQTVRRKDNHSLDIVRFYRYLSCWRFRSAALRWNERQKNFSFDMTPLAGFSRKTIRNRLHAAARFLSKSMVFMQKCFRRLSHRSIRSVRALNIGGSVIRTQHEGSSASLSFHPKCCMWKKGRKCCLSRCGP